MRRKGREGREGQREGGRERKEGKGKGKEEKEWLMALGRTERTRGEMLCYWKRKRREE